MKHETMKILFVIKKSSLLKNGEAPIVVRVTINGVSDEVRIQRSVLPRLWNQARGCCKGRDRVSIELNDYIESLKTKIHNLHKELVERDDNQYSSLCCINERGWQEQGEPYHLLQAR